MTARDKFLAVGVWVLSIPLVCRVSVCGAVLMAALLLAAVYLAWRARDDR